MDRGGLPHDNSRRCGRCSGFVPTPLLLRLFLVPGTHFTLQGGEKMSQTLFGNIKCLTHTIRVVSARFYNVRKAIPSLQEVLDTLLLPPPALPRWRGSLSKSSRLLCHQVVGEVIHRSHRLVRHAVATIKCTSLKTPLIQMHTL